MIVTGHVQDNRIVLDGDFSLPDGVRVEIILPDEFAPKSSGLCGIWKDDRTADEIVDEILSSRTVGRDATL